MQTYDCIAKGNVDDNSCAVVAAAIAADVPYEFARGLFHGKGREPNKGTPMEITVDALKSLDWHLERVYGHAGKSIQTIRKQLKTGVYLVRTKSHILCLREGVIEDWTKNRSLRVVEVLSVVRWRCQRCNTFKSVEACAVPPKELLTLPDILRDKCIRALQSDTVYPSGIFRHELLCKGCAKQCYAILLDKLDSEIFARMKKRQEATNEHTPF